MQRLPENFCKQARKALSHCFVAASKECFCCGIQIMGKENPAKIHCHCLAQMLYVSNAFSTSDDLKHLPNHTRLIATFNDTFFRMLIFFLRWPRRFHKMNPSMCILDFTIRRICLNHHPINRNTL
nr:hypothetical protein Iba_chr04dCG8580 [Ipomoea batatas]